MAKVQRIEERKREKKEMEGGYLKGVSAWSSATRDCNAVVET